MWIWWWEVCFALCMFYQGWQQIKAKFELEVV
jgi:hypothetical protein